MGWNRCLWVLVMVAALSATACGGDDDNGGQDIPTGTNGVGRDNDPPSDFSTTAGAALVQRLSGEESYQLWGTWPGEECQGAQEAEVPFLASGAPHGGVVRVFVNDIARNAATAFSGELPDGSVVVKENYAGSDLDNPGVLEALTIMQKVTGIDPDNNDWFWVKANADQTIDNEGVGNDMAGCVGCHSAGSSSDFILAYGFGGEPVQASLGDGTRRCAVADSVDPGTDPGTDPDPGTGPDPNRVCVSDIHNGHTYVFCRKSKNWFDASSDCMVQGKRLVHIDDAVENSWVRTKAFEYGLGDGVWLGGNDLGTEGFWEWAHGPTFWLHGANGLGGYPFNNRYHNFRVGEPNDWSPTGGEDCLLLQRDGVWNDINCQMLTTGYVCE